MSEFETDLKDLINKHSIDNSLETPDFLLGEYLIGCLTNYDKLVSKREKWRGASSEKTTLDLADQSLSENAIKRLHECAESDDQEVAHQEADEVLTDLLTALGYSDVVDAWEKVPKWYA